MGHTQMLQDAIAKIFELEQQLQQAHRAAEESAKDAHRRGWEQAKDEAIRRCEAQERNKSEMSAAFCIVAMSYDVANANLEYKGPTND